MAYELRRSANQMAELCALLEMEYLEAQQSHAAVCRQIEQVKRILAKLNASARAQANPWHAFNATGAELAWQNWSSARRSVIMEELALLYQRRELTKAQLKKAFGRLKAAEKVASDLANKVKRARANKAEKQLQEQSVPMMLKQSTG